MIEFTLNNQKIVDESAFQFRTQNMIGIDQIVFQDGTTWSRSDITYWATHGSIFFAGTGVPDTIIGSYLDQRQIGGAGADFIDGKGGSDLIFGDAGDDTLSISGWSVGEFDALDGGSNNDTITLATFGSGVSVDLVAGQVKIRSTDTLIATAVAMEHITGSAFDDILSGDDGANTIVGGNGHDAIDGRSGNDVLKGEAGNDTVAGYIGNDTLEGGAGADTLSGGLGNDTYNYTGGDGADTISEGQTEGTADVLRLKSVDPTKVSFERSGNDVVVRIAETTVGAGDGGTIRLTSSSGTFSHYDQYGIDSIVFDNGTTWTADYLRQRSAYEAATDGNDNLVGSAFAGDFGGGKGNDTLDAGGGNDIYHYWQGDGNDTIQEGAGNGTDDRLRLENIDPSQISLVRNGLDVTLVIAESSPGANNGGSVLIKQTLEDSVGKGVEKIVFANGTIWTMADLRLKLMAQAGTAGHDTIVGFSVSDTITGGLGNDTINGGDGDDIYRYARGDGQDTITEDMFNGTNDQLVLTNLAATDVTIIRIGTDIKVVVSQSSSGAGDGGSILIKATYDEYAERGIEKLVFANGSIWTRADINSHISSVQGTTGNDTVTGSSGNDTILGLAGNDTLTGGAGSDTFVFYPSFGKDTITDFVAGSGSADVIQLHPSVFADFGSVYAAANQVGSDTVVTFDANNTLTLKNVVKTNLHADDFSFMVA